MPCKRGYWRHLWETIQRKSYSIQRCKRCKKLNPLSAPWRERFWAKVKKGPKCWIWTGSRTPFGYGRLGINGISTVASRLSWLMSRGQMPSGDMMICHHCDNPPCVRPEHLFLGSPKANQHDRYRKHGPTNSKLTREQILQIRDRHEEGLQLLAAEFKVSRITIKRILERITWAWVF